MMDDAIVFALIVAGLVNGMVIGWVLIVKGRGRSTALALGLFLLVAVAAGLLILLYGRIPPGQAPFVLASELGLTLVSGPLLVIATAGLTGQQVPRNFIVGGLVAAIGFVGILAIMTSLDPVLPAVWAQIGFTIAAWRVFLRRTTQTDRRTRRFRQDRLALALLAALTLLHLVQVTKMVAPRAWVMAWSVPATLALFMAMAAFALMAIAARRFELGENPDTQVSSPLREKIERVIADHLADPEFSGERLAEAADIPLAQLRATFASEGGVAAAIRRVRIDKACDELADPDERRTSIDAIALGCGFRSRSAFYEAFRKERGCAPGEYREAMAERDP